MQNPVLERDANQEFCAIRPITGTIPTWYHHDRLGSTRVLTDHTGAVVGAFTYDPYGSTTATTGTATTSIGYAGAYKDSESGFLYLINRYYNPTTAQFLTRDPLNALTNSTYGYTADNPLSGTDPTGQARVTLGDDEGDTGKGAYANSVLETAGRQIRGGVRGGNFPERSSSGSVLYRADDAGNVTSYQVYGADGLPEFRVDVTGASHGGIETPHIQWFVRNTNPSTGDVYIGRGPLEPAPPEYVPTWPVTATSGGPVLGEGGTIRGSGTADEPGAEEGEGFDVAWPSSSCNRTAVI